MKSDFKADGYCGICNDFGAEIEINPTGEQARIAFVYPNGFKDVRRWSKIQGVKRRPYIKCRGVNYYLDNFMRY